MNETGRISSSVRLVETDIHDVMTERAGQSGSGGVSAAAWVRSGEALRGLLNRHAGQLPARAVVQIWSNVVFAGGPVSALHVFAGQNAPGFWDLARVHFGSTIPMTQHASAASVVHACADDRRSIGIVPRPEGEEEGQTWWEQLAAHVQEGSRVAQSLPFVREDGCAVPLPRGYAIASITQDETGKDATILRLECESDLSRTRLQSLLRQAGFKFQILSAIRGTAPGVPGRVLVACEGCVAATDERIASLGTLADEAIASIALVGGFASTFDAPAVSVA